MSFLSNWQIEVGKFLQRKQTNPKDIHCLGGNKLSARTLNEKELKLLLLYMNEKGN
mgnify:CR=1 FL=1